jgi:hypothetical protein
LSQVRCPNCRTVADAAFRFCFVCGVEYASGFKSPVFAPRPVDIQVRRDTKSSGVAIAVFGSFGAIGALHIVVVMPIPVIQKALLVLLVAGFAAFGFVAAFRQGSEHEALGRAVLKGFAVIAWLMLIGAVVVAGLLIYLFVLCATHVGKY